MTVDTYGNITNMVELVDSDSRDPIVDPTTSRKIYGLVQTDAVDGSAIAAP